MPMFRQEEKARKNTEYENQRRWWKSWSTGWCWADITESKEGEPCHVQKSTKADLRKSD